MSHEGVDGTVEVERAPHQQAVLSPQLRNHDCDQTIGEWLQQTKHEGNVKTSCWLSFLLHIHFISSFLTDPLRLHVGCLHLVGTNTILST